MITSGSRPCLSAFGAKFKSLCYLSWFSSLIVAVLFTVAATSDPDADNPDAQYVHIMTLIDRGDALRVSGKADAAKAKYKQAQAALENLKQLNPTWYPKTVAYRLNELNDRLETHPVVPDMVVPAKKPAAKPAVNLESEPVADASNSMVKLIDAGLEPRKVLRLHVKPGDKQSLTASVKVTMDMGGAVPAGKMPTIPAVSIPLDVTIDKVAPNGDITFDAVVGDGTLAGDSGSPPQMAMMAKGFFSTLKGLTVTATTSSRGATKNISVKAPPGADPKMAEAIAKAEKNIPVTGSPVLPAEAVGAGAKWEITAPTKTQGISVDQTATVQLVSVQGDQLTTTISMTSSVASGQKMDSPGGGKAIDMPQMNMSGNGNITSDLSKLFPSQATLDMHMDMTMNMPGPAGSQKHAMNMKADINIGLLAN